MDEAFVPDRLLRPDPPGLLNNQLRALLVEHGEGQGLDYFKIPGLTEFQNIPQDPANPINGAKITLGMYLFNEAALAVNNVRPEGFETYSCGSCHPAQAGFQSNRAQGIGEGGSGFGIAGEGRSLLPAYDSSPDEPDVTPIRVPSIVNMAYQDVVMWNGAMGGVGVNIGTESQWPGTPAESNSLGLHGLETQAFVGLNNHRLLDVASSQIPSNPLYAVFYQSAFPGQPIDQYHTALAIAAYERVVTTNVTPFQEWLRGKKHAMTDQQKRGAILFFGVAKCVDCHTGPALNSMTFHALGMNDLDGSYDPGNVDLTRFGGTVPTNFRLGRGGFTGQTSEDYQFKTPQLYNLKDSPFYGHGSSFQTVREVIEYKSKAIRENLLVPGSKLSPKFTPLGLSQQDIDDLDAFISDALYDDNIMRHFPTFVPTGLCFPSNDTQSRIDLGCSPAASPPPPVLARPGNTWKWLRRR